MRYNFSIVRAREINENNDLAKEEAIEMQRQFKIQGNQANSREMTHVYGVAVMADKMFELVKKEYFKLE